MSIGLTTARFTYVALTLAFSGGLLRADDKTSSPVVATVNGSDITQSDLEAEYLIRRVPAERQAALRKPIIDDLVDRRLIAAWLDQRKAPVPEPQLESRLDVLKRAVESGGQGSLADVLARRGLTEQQLRAQLALPLRWQAHIRRTVTDQQLREYFEARRFEFDGTQVRLRQIVISVPSDADETAWTQADATLQQVRSLISDGQLSFEEAARKHSTSPSAKQGGDLGFIGFRGRVPPAVAAAAFALMPNQLSEIVRSPVGVHLLQVVERKPGEYSLEDVREQVWEQKARDAWTEHVATARKSAKIEILDATP